MSKIKQWGCVALLMLGTVLLYGQFLWNPLVFDDLPFFMVDASGHQPVDDYRFSLFELRSFPYATLAWSKALLGLDLIYFRLENMLLHAAVAISLFFFMSTLLRTTLAQGSGSKWSAETWAFWGALFFALHPVAVYAAGYLIQRTMLMATLFSVLSMLAWLRGLESGRRYWLWAAVSLYFLAVFSKEHAIMLPVAILALTILTAPDWRAKGRAAWPMLGSMVAIALYVLFAKFGIVGRVYEPAAPEMLAAVEAENSFLLSVLTQSWLFFKYALLWLFPNPGWMSVDMREPFAGSLWSAYLFAFVLFASWGGLSIRLLFKRGRWGLLGFSMLFPWVMFMPELSTVRIQESFVLYRSYLWAVGVLGVLPLILDQMDRKVAGTILAAVLLAMIPVSMDRLATFSHPYTLWDDAAKLVKEREALPGVDRIYNNRGLASLALQYYPDAIEDFRQAIKLNPNLPSAYTNLGAAYLETGRFAEANAQFDRAIEIIERSGKNMSAKPYYGKGKAFEALGQKDAALEAYAISCRLGRKGCEKLAD